MVSKQERKKKRTQCSHSHRAPFQKFRKRRATNFECSQSHGAPFQKFHKGRATDFARVCKRYRKLLEERWPGARGSHGKSRRMMRETRHHYKINENPTLSALGKKRKKCSHSHGAPFQKKHEGRATDFARVCVNAIGSYWTVAQECHGKNRRMMREARPR